MRSSNAVRLALAAILVLTATVWTACSNADTGANSSTAATGGKVTITTKSEDARKEFLQGRDLAEKLLAQDSLQHFDKALALDPDFASAELARANNSPTAKEFFEHLNKAVSLADKASDGEKLFILANQAGTNGDVTKQKDALDKLVAAYPNDERARQTRTYQGSARRVSATGGPLPTSSAAAAAPRPCRAPGSPGPPCPPAPCTPPAP